MQVTIVPIPEAGCTNAHYVSNRSPLAPSPLVKLPLGSVRPRGWLKRQLALMADGMVGHLDSLSKFLAPDNGWLDGKRPGWEEQPYWLRGFYPLAALTGDSRCGALASRWIEAVLTRQDEGGYFGSSYHRRCKGKTGETLCDLWPHMLMLDALIQHHEFTGDGRVVALMRRFFGFCRMLPDEEFIPHVPAARWESYREDFGDWKVGIQIKRAGDMLPHIYWLYNRTGEAPLLELASRFYDSILLPVNEWLDDHIVNFTQRFAYAGIYGQQSQLARRLAQSEYWYTQHMGTWGQQPRGIFAADERVRPGKTDPRQGFETCGMVEFAKSFHLLGRITGDPIYADRAEDVMLNHFPAAQTPDLKGLRYLTASNLPQSDAGGQHDFFNGGPQLVYSPHMHRCCQHNVAMGWPWHVQNLWQATADDGLAAWMYAACDVTAKAGPEGTAVTLGVETVYPFGQKVVISVNTAAPVRFPLYLRVPRWCEGLVATVNGDALDARGRPGTYLRIERNWSDGDSIDVDMPMRTSLTTWPRTGAVTVDRGPVSYSVKVAEQWRRCGGTNEWPEWEVLPGSDWNYGLALDGERPSAWEVVEKDTVAPQPWTAEDAPVEIHVPAKRIPTWALGEDQTVQPLRPSPVRSDQPGETITMVPLGCARLRMSCLPVVSDGPEGRDWHPAEGHP